MNFKNKIILFIIFPSLLFVILLGYFFYFQDNNIIFNNSSKEEEKRDIKCYEDISKLNVNDFIKEVKKLDQYIEETNEFNQDPGKVNKSYLYTAGDVANIKIDLIDYLMCQLKEEKEEFNKNIYTELANRTLKLIGELNVSDKLMKSIASKDFNKDGMLVKMFYKDNNESLLDKEYTILNDIALGSLDDFCTGDEEKDYFLENCLSVSGLLEERKNNLSTEEIETIDFNCNNFCENINRYIDNKSDFETDMNQIIWPEDNIIKEAMFKTMHAVAFRIYEKESTLVFCDSIEDKGLGISQECKNYINSLDYINCSDFSFNKSKECNFKEYDKCQSLREKVNKSFCNLNKLNYIK